MCIIAVKEKNRDLIDKEIFMNMWDNNDDGGGFAYVNKFNELIIEKGFLDKEEMWSRVNEVFKEEDLYKKHLVLHFRISTSGFGGGSKNSKSCTHPFPIGYKNKEMMKLTYLKTKMPILFHNGIIRRFEYGNKNSEYSDTMNFVHDYVNKIYKQNSSFMYNKKALKKIYKNGEQCKFALLDNKDMLVTLGDFITEDELGWKFSNATYSYSLSAYINKSKGSYNSYDYYYDKWNEYDWDNYYEDYYGYGQEDYSDFYGEEPIVSKKTMKDIVEEVEEWNTETFMNVLNNSRLSILQNGTEIKADNFNMVVNDKDNMNFGVSWEDNQLFYINFDYQEVVYIHSKIKSIKFPKKVKNEISLI